MYFIVFSSERRVLWANYFQVIACHLINTDMCYKQFGGFLKEQGLNELDHS